MTATGVASSTPVDASAESRAWGWPVTVLLVVAAIAGLGVRLWALFAPIGGTDSDEAVVGLMAGDVLRGRFKVFYWGQSYGGTAELALGAVSRALFGSSTFAMRLPMLVLSVVAVWLLWRIARRQVSELQAAVAAATFWVLPVAFVQFSGREMLFFWPTVVLGLVVLLTGQRVVAEPDRWWPYVALWLVAGLAFWTSAFIAYFLLPALAFVVLSLRRLPVRLVVAAPLFLIGSLPWWAWNIVEGFPSLDEAQVTQRAGAVQRLDDFVNYVLRSAFGMETVDTRFGAWRWITFVLFLGLLALLAVIAVRAVTATVRRGRPVPIDVLGLVIAAAVYVALPLRAPVPVVRYALFVWPFTALLLGRLAVGRRAAVAVLAGALALSVFGTRQLIRDPGPPSLDQVKSVLAEEGIHHAFADYFVAYRLTFETDEDVLSAAFYSDRQPRYAAAARAAPNSTYVFAVGSPDRAVLEEAAEARGLTFRVLPAGEFVVYVIDGQLYPEDVSPDRPLSGL